MPNPSTRTVTIGSVAISAFTLAEVVGEAERAINANRQLQITTPNFDHVLQCRTDIDFRRIINHSLAVGDGMGVVYASKVIGTPLPGLVGGRLLIEPMCALAARRGWSVGLLGGDPGVARRAAELLRARHWGLNVVAMDPGPIEAESSVAFPCYVHIVFVALGTPKQEKWIARHLASSPVNVAVGVGAGLSVIAGNIPSPPVWMTAVGLEWLVRLLHEPSRLWRRYIVGIPIFCVLVLRQAVRVRWGRHVR